MMGKLEKCPFCGSSNVRIGKPFVYWMVDCRDCSCRVTFEPQSAQSREATVAAWNKRTTTTTNH